jgi:hypothetical protein
MPIFLLIASGRGRPFCQGLSIRGNREALSFQSNFAGGQFQAIPRANAFEFVAFARGHGIREQAAEVELFSARCGQVSESGSFYSSTTMI